MPADQAPITILHENRRTPLFGGRIAKTAGEPHYIVQMHAPRSGESEKYIPAARRLLAETYEDTGDHKGDLMRALIPHLIDYIPEYAKAAEQHSRNGRYSCMPAVTFCLTDGQMVAVGRPDGAQGIKGPAVNPDCALQWNKPSRAGHGRPTSLTAMPPRVIRNLDAEFASQCDPGFDTDRFRPVVQVLALLLAAAEPLRSKILESTQGENLDQLPNGPLRVRKLEL